MYLLTWLDVWSLSLSQVISLRTGYSKAGFLDVHLVNDEEAKNRTGYAVHISALSYEALPLAMGWKL